MFQFLNPIWLFAAAAVIIPVVIHLWNIRPGKVLKVGSTALIQAASRRNSRSFKLLDIPLLLLRCLLLILLALILALPFIQKRIQTAKTKGWILIPKVQFSQTYQHFKPTVDSLTKTGYEFHFFNNGFAKADLKKLLADTKKLKSIDTTLQQPSPYWSLLNQLDNRIASDMPVYLFTENTLNHFGGERPQIGFDLNWKTYTPADSAANWIQSAWFTNNNTIRVVTGKSTPNNTSLTYNDIQADKGDSQFNISVNDGQPKVSLKDSQSEAVNVDTATLRIAIYNDKYITDANYLKAALDAVVQFSHRKAIVKQYNSPNAIPVGQSWVFWLSDRPYAARLIKKPTRVFAYQTGKTESTNTTISAINNLSLPNCSDQLSIFKRINNNQTKGEVLWRDGFGRPVLSKEQQDNAEVYRFFTHFNPAWNDLAWNGSFPKWIFELLANKAGSLPDKHDRRSMIPEQMQPIKIAENHTVSSKTSVQKELDIYLWILLALTFVAERWLATKNKIADNG